MFILTILSVRAIESDAFGCRFTEKWQHNGSKTVTKWMPRKGTQHKGDGEMTFINLTKGNQN